MNTNHSDTGAYTIDNDPDSMKPDRSDKNFMLKDLQAILTDLKQIGKSLDADRNESKFLKFILQTCLKSTGAHAGILYYVEKNRQDEQYLRLKYSYFLTGNFPFKEVIIPMDNQSLAGFAGLSLKSLAIPDVYSLASELPYTFKPSFDDAFKYQTKSIAVVPIISSANEPLGVIQLINRKNNNSVVSRENTPEPTVDFGGNVISFSSRDIILLELIAGQTAISLENYWKIQKLEDQFEEFVSASIKTIESRDPVTRGHSLRVASLCTKIAEDMGLEYNQVKTLEYAALLHDFGKILINPEVQYKKKKKKKKLHAHDKERIDLTLDYLYRYQELSYSRHEIRLHNMLDLESDSFAFLIRELHQERDEILGSIREAKDMVGRYSDPDFSSENSEEELNQTVRKLHSLRCLDIHDRPFLPFRAADLYNLSIVTGTLNAREEQDLQEHVVRTYEFLKNLTWPEHLREVPEICLLHKERLDGTGYPSGLKGKDIPLLSRILALADMYDELITKGRAYEKISSNAPIIEILIEEAEDGRLDSDVALTLKKLTGSDY